MFVFVTKYEIIILARHCVRSDWSSLVTVCYGEEEEVRGRVIIWGQTPQVIRDNWQSLLKQTILGLMIYKQCCLAPDHSTEQAIQLCDGFILITIVMYLLN